MPSYRVLKKADVDPSETDELEELRKQANDVGGFLHVEIWKFAGGEEKPVRGYDGLPRMGDRYGRLAPISLRSDERFMEEL